MAREIKFRAWLSDTNHKENQQMIYGDYLGTRNEFLRFWDNVYSWTGNICIIEQYTGLTDKHGVEIWEGDRVKHKSFGKVSTVKYYNIYCAFVLVGEDEVDVDIFNLDHFNDQANGFEVIGNIHTEEAK